MSTAHLTLHQVLAQRDTPMPGEEFLTLLDEYRLNFWQSQPKTNQNSYYTMGDDIRLVRAWLARQAHVEYFAALVTLHQAEISPWEDIKLDYIRQAQDEMRHYKLCRGYLEELGEKYNLEAYVPDFEEWQRLLSLISTVDHQFFLDPAKEVIARAMILNYAAEGWAYLHMHPVFIEQTRELHPELAVLFEESITPDEAFHFEIGRKVLRDRCTTLEHQRHALTMLDRQLQTQIRLVEATPQWMERVTR